ncbi:MAG TPA: flavin reductase family protein [Candidatus Limiplasma sp.]|nr:flavin reductase family protein [Candidatus Limiplasma sp.]HPS82390.1 flavin reductase family protein [Candidatus Limiplasma sp.]
MDNPAFRPIGPTTYLCPTPTVLVGCAADSAWQQGKGGANLITVAWAGICCTKPPMLSISLRPERHSHALIERSGEFTVNLIGEPLLPAMDFCGVKSGRDLDKFTALGLHPQQADPLSIAPALREAPAYLCCKVRQVLPLGTHDLFLAEIVQVHVGKAYFREDGSINEQAMRLVAYVHGKYRALGAEIGFFGFSVAGDAARKRRAAEAKETAAPKTKPVNANRSPKTPAQKHQASGSDAPNPSVPVASRPKPSGVASGKGKRS